MGLSKVLVVEDGAELVGNPLLVERGEAADLSKTGETEVSVGKAEPKDTEGGSLLVTENVVGCSGYVGFVDVVWNEVVVGVRVKVLAEKPLKTGTDAGETCADVVVVPAGITVVFIEVPPNIEPVKTPD